MLNKYIIIVAILTAIGSYSLGRYNGMHAEAIKNSLQAQKIEIDGLKKKIVIEKQIQEKIQDESNKLEKELKLYEINYKQAKEQIYKDREYINSHNTIRHSFVRHISTSPMPNNAAFTAESSASDRIIAADRVLHFIKDLQNHDNQCVTKYNKLLNIYNAQFKIINNEN